MVISKKMFWRLIALLSCNFCIASIVLSFFFLENLQPALNTIFVSVIVGLLIISEFFLLIRPLTYTIYIIWGYIFAIGLIILGEGALSIIVYINTSFIVTRLPILKEKKYYKKIIFIISGILYFLGLTSVFRFSFEKIISVFIGVFSVVITCAIMYFVIVYLLGEKDFFSAKRDIKKTNDIFENKDFSDSDKRILKHILEGYKYEVIADEENLSVSYLKKRISKLYTELGVTNQIDFITRYKN